MIVTVTLNATAAGRAVGHYCGDLSKLLLCQLLGWSAAQAAQQLPWAPLLPPKPWCRAAGASALMGPHLHIAVCVCDQQR